VHYHTTGTKLLFLDCIFQKHRKLKLIIKKIRLTLLLGNAAQCDKKKLTSD